MRKIWDVLSFRQRLLLPIAAMIVSALMSGGVALLVFSPDQFEYENEKEAGSARAVANALNAALKASCNPKETLDAFGTNLGNGEAVGYLPAGAAAPARTALSQGGRVPAWFVSNLAIPDLAKSYPVGIGNARVGAIVFTPDLSADIWEKWMGFLAIVSTGSLPMLFAAFGTHLVAGRTIRPMERLGAGLTRMREGDYDAIIPLTGPPEIRGYCREANQLAATLKQLSRDNRDLLRKLVSLQDEERRRIARELHDEMGPLLFAIRANVAVLSESASERSAPSQGLVEAAEALQRANKRILQGLSPLYLEELGLSGSLDALLRDARKQLPSLRIRSNIGRDLDALDGVLSQTTYRVMQEGVTNVVRHANASDMEVSALIDGENLRIEVADDGPLLPDLKFGRGLTGMSERVRALDGKLDLSRENGRTTIRCSLPIHPATLDQS
ncbi:histidine kinase [Bradyrhizobium diazoefficiens]|uniref:Sensor histidine kinase n=1 Tax=Bradyrhizobium diazoefficiens TaxID=1355477 RepID=A0A809WRB4_9BRAD|nr:sensor histidine kinase [Bradyrhizobium diazoefficiens]BCF22482.1 sensor histidine kinase [Bradyrhizobium diazoefficiens]